MTSFLFLIKLFVILDNYSYICLNKIIKVMIYKYNKNTLSYDKITFRIFWIILLIVGLFSLISYDAIVKHISKIENISEETKAIIIKEADKENEFSREKLKAYLLELNIKYPHIVLAQAEIETGHFTSTIFKENHNCFGLKQATRRPSTAQGTDNNHAYYKDWRESVQDYAMFQAAYLKDIHTENEYLQYLKQNYAEDSTYIDKIKQIIKKINTLGK